MGLAETFRALSDPIRRELLLSLRDGRKSAGELAKALNIAPTALSYHLSLLKRAHLLLEYRQKNFIYYELNATLFDELLLWLKQFSEAEVKTEERAIVEE